MGVRKQGRYVAALVGLVAAVSLAGCGGTPTPAASPSPGTSTASTSPSTTTSPSTSPSPSTGPSTPAKPTTEPSTQEPVKDQVEIDITIAGGKVDPSGKKIDVPLGATVVLKVTSDADDEIHAHVGSGDGYSLEVKPGAVAQGRFKVTESGSFEIESHELGKIIAILNVR